MNILFYCTFWKCLPVSSIYMTLEAVAALFLESSYSVHSHTIIKGLPVTVT